MCKIKRTICPVCGEFEFVPPTKDLPFLEEMFKNGQINCSVCGWIYDEEQNKNYDLKVGFNKMSVNEYKKIFLEKREKDPNYNYSDENAPDPVPHKCPICGEYEFEDENSYDICPVCGWNDDGWLDEPMANRYNAEESIKRFKQKRKKDPNYRWEKEFD